MRIVLTAAALAALVSVGACEQSKSVAAPEAPPPKKSLARPAMLGEGQEQLLSVESGAVSLDKTGALVLRAKGATPAAGYTNATFVRRIYAASPPDGIWEVDLVAQRPTGAAAQAVTPIEVKGEWAHFPRERLKGVKFMTRTNSVTAMLPAEGGGSPPDA